MAQAHSLGGKNVTYLKSDRLIFSLGAKLQAFLPLLNAEMVQ